MIDRFVLFVLTSVLAIVLLVSTCGSQVFAASSPRASTPSGTKVNERLVRVQTSLDKLVTHLENLVKRIDKISDNIQRKIIRAKAGGRDTVKMESLMKDSREKLIKVNSEISELKTMREVGKTRADYLKVREQVKLIKTDLHSIQRNISEIISTLKGDNASDRGFENRASESTKSSR